MIGCVKWFSFNFGCKVTIFSLRARAIFRGKCVKIDTPIVSFVLKCYKLTNFVESLSCRLGFLSLPRGVVPGYY